MTRKLMEREARQKFVVDAARQLFAEQGIENTSMEDIADAAGYTRRTLYAYFKSRDEISLMVFVEDLKNRWEFQKKQIAGTKTGLDKILLWARSFYEYSQNNPHTLRMHFYWDYLGIDRDKISRDVFGAFEAVNDELAEGLREIFRSGVKDGSLRPDLKIDLCISQFLYTQRSVVNRALLPTYSFADFKPDKYIEHYLDLFTRAIRNQKEQNHESQTILFTCMGRLVGRLAGGSLWGERA